MHLTAPIHTEGLKPGLEPLVFYLEPLRAHLGHCRACIRRANSVSFQIVAHLQHGAIGEWKNAASKIIAFGWDLGRLPYSWIALPEMAM